MSDGAPQGLRGLAPQHPAELLEGGDAVRFDPVLVLTQAGGALGRGPGDQFQLPGPGSGLVNPQRGFQTLLAAVLEAGDELLPGEDPEQGRHALGVSLQRLVGDAVGDVVDAGVDEVGVDGELLSGLGVGESAGADLGLTDDVHPADVQLPVVAVAGAATDVIRGADALRHQEVPDGVVSLLGVGSGGATALAGLGDVLNRKAVVHGGFSGQLVRLLHDDSPLS